MPFARKLDCGASQPIHCYRDSYSPGRMVALMNSDSPPADCRPRFNRERGNPTPQDQKFLADAIEGLSKSSKRVSSKYLYDERGSALFDQICKLPEYYPTRTELSIMKANVMQIVREIGPHANVIELGSGSSLKTRLLLDHLDQPRTYLPIDVSEKHVLATVKQLRDKYPDIEIVPIVDDFCVTLNHSGRFSEDGVCVYFPGSTIGNFTANEALGLLRRIGDWCGNSGGLLIGFDLQKKVSVLEAAYNDADGITAEFSLNLLHRINRELSANFDVDQFGHVAFYNSSAERIEIFLESKCDQIVRIGTVEIPFDEGERIHTEYSYKYTVAGFREMAAKAGLAMRHVWLDDQKYFAVMYLESSNADRN